MPDPSVIDYHILVVDDEPSNLKLLDQILTSEGYRNVRTTTDSKAGLDLILSGWPDLVLLDLKMPPPDGFQILKTVRSHPGTAAACPILVFTSDQTTLTRRTALELGASDFLTKPGDLIEIVLRVRNFLELRKLQRHLESANRTLEDKVLTRTQELKDANVEVVYRLARAAEYRDDQTGEHINRVGKLSYMLALKLGFSPEDAETVRLAAPLHDVGKIALSDSILLKQGPLTPDERKVMERHTVIGAGILAKGKSELLKMAEVIALTHHERWDGGGYPHGLAGENIPLVGRILAVADVYDALTHDRPYKKAWPRSKAIEEIEANAGYHFDPQVVAALMAIFRGETQAVVHDHAVRLQSA
ncbi:MAG: cyclic di-GMP phosphodiesterase [Fimbriimonadaceae bacterium]|jgi:putative two-component system response regulator|nr:cyclic di-GMP phosphodiesterase [Fimbriimonadaceae bacterium]